MRAEARQEVIVTLELSEAEAGYIRDVLHNFIGADKETPRDKDLRLRLYEGIADALAKVLE